MSILYQQTAIFVSRAATRLRHGWRAVGRASERLYLGWPSHPFVVPQCCLRVRGQGPLKSGPLCGETLCGSRVANKVFLVQACLAGKSHGTVPDDGNLVIVSESLIGRAVFVGFLPRLPNHDPICGNRLLLDKRDCGKGDCYFARIN